MKTDILPDNPYVLLTPGPLSTTKTVKVAMLRDWCTWDDEYNKIVQGIRERLMQLAGENTEAYTAVLMQGSGTFCVESVIGSALPQTGKLLVLINGAYGQRIVQMARILGIETIAVDSGEITPVDVERLEEYLRQDPLITHVAVVHTETTTGMLNPVEEVARIVKVYGKRFIVDAMSSFGGITIDVSRLGVDFLISSANKCIQGVPGFGFVIAHRDALAECEGRARSLSLDLYDQWKVMEEQNGKWRFTSPTHVVRAFDQALRELEAEGGIERREARYRSNQKALVEGMEQIGFCTLLDKQSQSPIITSFYYPDSPMFTFEEFYGRLKASGFVIYPGKITVADTFRVGSIGDVYPEDMERLVESVKRNRFW
ncbi:2-aminoethylphosphonate--pyruvate transaminase [Aneurinibacillus aneurinilyticus]|uniref:2-aminoethylphosphonate--pyruvate transaminase n=1 Tax=Aneurinibacillus aneurinilyticus TaxID=1391 RepID=UPI002E1A90BB|nr:2-aminoethylphosphonate--pyruvate transaminase [Aneurinibacillus aneurinilyticus]MED0669100.1 2-aminoethylphosphonate--pyruvate transaminase [Aneurinibacillus aneurinilyticus]